MPGEQLPRTAVRATIHDVARLAGVSRQTVSRAINDKGEIDPATKERVLRAAKTLDYRPSRFARGLRRRGTVTVGLVVSDLTNPYFPEVAAGVLEVARERGWQVVVAESRGVEGELAALRVLADQVDAIVGYCDSSDEVLAEQVAGMPLVLIEPGPDETRYGSVGIDVVAGMRQAVEHLIATGHRRIGMLDGAPDDRPSPRRLAFLAELKRHGLDRITAAASRTAGAADTAPQTAAAGGQAITATDATTQAVGAGDAAPQTVAAVVSPLLPRNSPVVAATAHTVGGGRVAMVELLDRWPDVTAVVGFNDLIAIGAIQAARARGLRIPEQLAVLGFDGLSLGELIEPTLTSLRIDKPQVGRLAVEQVARMLDGRPPLRDETAWVRPELVVRASTGEPSRG